MKDLLVFDDEQVRPLVDFSGLQCAAGTLSDWVKIIPVGKWRHLKYGKVDITPSTIQRIVANFNANVLGVEVPIQHPEHKDDAQGAYGWTRELEAREDGAYARFELTDLGQAAYGSGRFKYLSPHVFLDRPWRAPDGSLVPFVLTEVSPTNNPFLRYDGANRLAATLGEFEQATEEAPDEGPEEAPPAESVQDEGSAEVDDGKPDPKPDGEPGGNAVEGDSDQMADETKIEQTPEPQAPEAPAPVQATTGDTDLLAALSATNEQLSSLQATNAELRASLEAIAHEKRVSETEHMVSGWKFSHEIHDQRGKIVGRTESVLCPADQELVTEVLLALPEDLAEKFSARMGAGGLQFAEMGEYGGGIAPSPNDESVYDEVTPATADKARALRASKPDLSPVQALNAVLMGR